VIPRNHMLDDSTGSVWVTWQPFHQPCDVRNF